VGAVESGGGHVLRLGDEWVTYDSSESAFEYQVAQFWVNALTCWWTAQCRIALPSPE
jgi:hypothetical protein